MCNTNNIYILQNCPLNKYIYMYIKLTQYRETYCYIYDAVLYKMQWISIFYICTEVQKKYSLQY